MSEYDRFDVRLLFVVALLCVWLCAAHHADGAARAGAAPVLALAPAHANPGSVVLVTGRGFSPGETVTLGIDRTPLASAPADAAGRLPVTGIVLPMLIRPGAHRVYALGRQSGLRGQALLTVLPLSPALSAVSGAARPGSVVIVRGTGFLPGESIALALNGAALAISDLPRGAPGLFAGPDGAFEASFVAPVGLLAGVNTISATGSTSHLTVLTGLVADLPVRSDLFVAGASTAMGEHPFLAVLNPGSLPAALRVRLLSVAGSSVPRSLLRLVVAPYSRATIDLAAAAGPNRQFGVRVLADRRIAAQLVEESARTGARSVPTVTAPQTTWLLAEGFTGLTFHETLALLNPGDLAAQAQVRLLLANGQPGRTVRVMIPASHEVVLDVNRYVSRRAVAVAVASDLPLVVNRTLRFGVDGTGAATTSGSPLASSTWLFAEGSTSKGFQTYLTVLNPTETPAVLTASFYDQQGRPLGNSTIRVDPLHRGTLRVNDVLRSVPAFATFVTSSVPVVVERPMYLGDPNGRNATGAAVLGSNGPSPVASLADGAGGPGIQERILLLNPTAHTALVTLRIFPEVGLRWPHPVTLTVHIPPLARHSISVDALLRALPPGAHGSILQSTNKIGFVAEQTIYSSAKGRQTFRSTPALVQ